MEKGKPYIYVIVGGIVGSALGIGLFILADLPAVPGIVAILICCAAGELAGLSMFEQYGMEDK